MKKIFCVMLVILMCMVPVFTGCGGEQSNGGGSVVDNAEDISITTGLGMYSNLEINSNGTQLDGEQPLGPQAQAFLNGVFYFEGTVFTMDNEGMPMNMATDANKNLHLETSVEGMTITFLILDKQPYLINNATKTYIEVNSRLMSMLGLKTDSLTEITNFTANTSGASSSSDGDAVMTQTAVLINGEEGICDTIEYKTEDGKTNSIKLYTVGDKLCQAENYDENGNMTMQMAFTLFSPEIPSDKLTLAGYTKGSFYSFIKGLVSE